MKKKVQKLAVLSLASMTLLSGCGTKTIPTLENGEQAIVSFKDDVKISINDFYNQMKDKYGTEVLLNMIDKLVLEKKYSDYTEEAKKNAESVMTQLKSSYGDNLLSAIQTYTGYQTLEEYQDYVYLSNLQSKAAEDYAKKNISEKEIRFWINRSGSQYELEGLEEDGSYTGKRPLILEESNLNHVETCTLMYVWNGETRILEEGMDYIRSVRQEDSGMHYRYVLDTGLFTRAGQYTVTLLTEDEAGNKSSNLQNAFHNFSINFEVENPVAELSRKPEENARGKTADTMENGETGAVKKWIYVMCLVLYLLRKSACILEFPVV